MITCNVGVCMYVNITAANRKIFCPQNIFRVRLSQMSLGQEKLE